MHNLNLSHHQSAWSDKSDSEIWEAIKNDDQGAFTFLYNEYVKALYDYGMKIHADDYFIGEALQNLFVEIWNRRKNRSVVKNIRFYLFKSLRYKIFNELKKQKKVRFFALEDQREEISIISPFESILISTEDEKEKRFKIASLVKRLPEQQREVINLLFYQDYSYEEISEIMGINIRSVYTLAWKAISRLRKTITEFIVFIPISIPLFLNW